MKLFVAPLVIAAVLATQLQQAGPPIRVLPGAQVVSTEKLASVVQVRVISGGRALVNDAAGRRLLLFDSTLRLIRVVADSAAGSANPYGVAAGRLLAYRGDSSILIDGASLSMLILDGDGNIAGITATPLVEHVTYFVGGTYGIPGVDAQGRLVYRIVDPSASLYVAPGGGIVVPNQPDSAPVLRLNFESKQLDTIGKVRIQRRIREPYRTAAGDITSRLLTTPMPVVDDWAVMADGSVAFVRHHDYHIDWLNPDGTVTSSKPMPFPWQPMSAAHKSAFIDSVRTVLEDNQQKEVARYDSINHACFDVVKPPRPWMTPEQIAALAAAAAPQSDAMNSAAPPAVSGGAAGASSTAARASARVRPKDCPPSQYIVEAMLAPVNVISPSMLPDTKPPFAANSTRADADGNLWIRVNQMDAVAKTTLYDVVNRNGELFDRIRIPDARTLVGFGPGGIAFLAVKGDSTVVLERVNWRARGG